MKTRYSDSASQTELMSAPPDEASAPPFSKALAQLDATAWARLIKLRLTSMSSATVLFGWAAAGGGQPATAALLLGGAFLMGAGAAIMNEAIEWPLDARMKRTHERPIACGQITPRQGIILAGGIAASGGLILFAAFGSGPALIGVLVFALYAGCYTPLKRITHWATEVGAVAGALPPLMGWLAVENPDGDPRRLALALLLLWLWQMVHFHPIAYRYRRQYRAAGMQLLGATARGVGQLDRHITLYAVAMALASFIPWFAGWSGPVMGALLIAANGFYSFLILRFRRPALRARTSLYLFRYSLIYLPLVLWAAVG